MKKVLLVSAERLGDTLFLTPSLQFLHKQLPDLMIDAIAVTKLAGAVLSNNPCINRLFVQPSEAELSTVSHDYDAVLILHASPEARDYAKQFNAKVIENNYSSKAMVSAEKPIKFFSDVFNLSWDAVPIPYQLFPQLSDKQYVESLLKEKSIDVNRDFIIAMHVGCHGLAKYHTSWFKRNKHRRAWPLNNFAKLAKKISQLHPNAKFLLTGSQAEEALVEKVRKKYPKAISLVNQLSVMQLAEFFKQSRLLISADTGVVHIACAMQTPLVSFYLTENAKNNSPYPPSDRFVVLQNDDLSQLSIEEVLQAVSNFELPMAYDMP